MDNKGVKTIYWQSRIKKYKALNKNDLVLFLMPGWLIDPSNKRIKTRNKNKYITYIL